MKVIFLRHGESEYNAKGLINQDPGIKIHLTFKGKKQSEEVAKKFEGIRFDVIFVSEFSRTKETAEIINRHYNVPVLVDSRLNEARVGFEGKTDAEYKLATSRDPFNFKLLGKESWQDLKKRVKNFLQDLKKENYNCVLIVSHQWTTRVANQIINKFSDKEAYALPLKNCDFFEFEI